MKLCSRCSISKDESEFHRQRDGRDGLQSMCKECNKRRSRDYARLRLHESPEEWRATGRERVRKHRARQT